MLVTDAPERIDDGATCEIRVVSDALGWSLEHDAAEATASSTGTKRQQTPRQRGDRQESALGRACTDKDILNPRPLPAVRTLSLGSRCRHGISSIPHRTADVRGSGRFEDGAVSLLRSLRGGADEGADLLPGDAGRPRLRDCFDEMPLAASSGNDGSLEEVLLNREVHGLIGVEVFEPLRQFVGTYTSFRGTRASWAKTRSVCRGRQRPAPSTRFERTGRRLS